MVSAARLPFPRPTRLLPALALATFASGCSSLTADWIDYAAGTGRGQIAGAPDDRHPITVRVAPRILELPIEIADRSDAQRAIVNFARSHAATGEGPIQVAYPRSGGPVAREAAAAAIRVLHEAGAPDSAIVTGPYDVAEAGRSGLVLSYSEPRAFSAGCPSDWGDPTRDTDNQRSERLGCAVQHNLAAMIDRPRDLLGPRPSTPAVADRRAAVLGAYVEGASTASETTVEGTQTTKF
ncbi:MAG: CpaD family pilus assembly lipoprotein [Pseudomonadota bacterium]